MPLKDFEEFTKDKPELAKELADVYDKAGAHPTLTANKKDLTTQRATWETEKKDLQKQLKEAQEAGEKSPLVLQLKKDLEAVNLRLNTSDEAAKKATAEKLDSDLESHIVGSAGTAFNPKQVAALMRAEGLAAVKEGKVEFYTKDSAGQLVLAKTHGEAVDAYLKGNAHLVKPSNEGGSGEQTNRGGGGGDSKLLSNPADNL
jgi:hypothetical protein